MKEGDLITAYHAGIHRIIKIQERWNNKNDVMLPCFYEYNKNCGDKIGDLVTYVQIANSQGKLLKTNKIQSCDIAWCKPLQEYIDNLENVINKLKSL